MSVDPERVQAIFSAAVEQQEAANRAAVLERLCGTDADLRQRVETLLKAHDAPGSFLENSGASQTHTAGDPSVSERPGTMIGPYKLLEQIGEGGFGVVYLAEQTEPVRRKVALKILKPGMDTRQIVARFEAERQALAIMDHPNIAKVFDGGMTQEPAAQARDSALPLARAAGSGRPFFVMELVKGIPITEYCDQNHLTPRQRLELFIPVCQAVQHAHQKGIIHRDLKPSNVLVTRHDSVAVPKVIDFGVAKALGQELTDKTLFTAIAQMIGTPLYMSPEQAGMSDLDVDTRSDIYSLGVLLYELLTGTTPFEKERFKKAAYDEIRRIIREEEPPKPSTRLSDLSKSRLPGRTADSPARQAGPTSSLASVSALRQTEPAKLTKLVKGELDWIVMKCLEKDRSRRYETANGFAVDIQRYLADEPVQACPPSARYRLQKFARRHKRGLATAAVLSVVLLAAVGAVAGTLGWAARDRSARRVIVTEKVQLALHDAETLGDKALTFVDDNPYQWESTLAQALAALHQAEGVAEPEKDSLDPGVMERLAALKARLEADEKDRQFVARFEEIRLEATELDEARARLRTREQPLKIKELFRAHGIDITSATPEQIVSWLHKHPEPVQKHMIAALGVCLVFTPVSAAAERESLGAAMAAILETESWGRPALKAAAARDWESVERLLRDPKLKAHRPAFLIHLVVADFPPEMQPAKLNALREIQSAYPGDFWANFNCAGACDSAKPPQFDDEIRFLQAALALRPRNSAVRYSLGRALVQKGDPDGAIVEFRLALELDPRNSITRDTLGWALLKRGELEPAIAEFRRAIELDPKNANAHNNLGVALKDKGDFDGAVAEHRRAIELDPKDPGPRNSLGNALYAKGDLDGAIPEYRRAIELDPKKPDGHNNLGTAFQKKGDLDGAIAEYRRAIALDPGCAAAHTNLGTTLADKGNLDGAIVEHRRAIELDPKLVDAHNNLGNALWTKEDRDGAIAEYRRAIALDPKSALSHFNLGAALQQTADPDGAMAEYRHAVGLDPKHVNAHFNLAIVLQAKGNLDGSMAECRQAIALAPRLARAQESLGRLLCDKGDFAGAVNAYRKCLNLTKEEAAADKRNPAAKYALGYAYLRLGELSLVLGDVTTARDCYHKNFEIWQAQAATKPNDAQAKADLTAAHRNLAQFHTGAGEMAAAVEQSRQALKVLPDDINAWVEHAAILLLAGDAKTYRHVCGQMLERFGETKDAFVAHYAARGFSLAPEALADSSRTVQLAEKSIAAQKLVHYVHALALAQYRAGRFDEAIRLANESLTIDPNWQGTFCNWLVLALAHHRRGEVEAAGRWLLKAEARMDKIPPKAGKAYVGPLVGIHPGDWLEGRILRREAEGLIQRRETKQSEPGK